MARDLPSSIEVVLGVVAILMAQGGRLDEGYLRQWSDALGVTDLLDRALREASGA